MFWKLGVVWDVVEMDPNIVARYHVVTVTLPWYPEVKVMREGARGGGGAGGRGGVERRWRV